MSALAASTPTGLFGVDWSSIGLVFVVGLAATVVIVAFYSLGLRLLAVGSPMDGDDQHSGPVITDNRPAVATVGGFACIGVGVLALLYGIYLVVPLLHAS
jgi:hypothetical protein